MIVALDPSLTSTGIVLGDSSEDWEVFTLGSTNRGDAPSDRISRYQRLIKKIFASIKMPVELILIEGYSFGSEGRALSGLHEFGGILRWHLVDVAPVLEVAPTTLKKFVTGRGNSPKLVVAAEISRRWNVGFKNSDEYDAFALFRLGLIVSGRQPAENNDQRRAAELVAQQLPVKPVWCEQ